MSTYGTLKSRVMALFFLFFCLFCGLLFQLVKIQLLESPELAYKALEQRTEKINLAIPRGELYDRRMIPLTNRVKVESLMVFPQIIKQKRELAHFLARLVNLPEEEILVKLENNTYPFRLGPPLNDDLANYLTELNIPGVLVIEEKKRFENRPLAAHLIGYINTIDNKGVSGLEKSLDQFLKKQAGESIAISMDAHKKLILGLGIKKQKPPPELEAKKVILTLDYQIQKVVEAVMDKEIRKGAIVVMDPYTGDILAMASRPTFNPNKVYAFFDQGNAALMNRAVSGYPPGSIFKIITASAALEEGLVHLHDQFYCPGYIMVNNLKIACHAEKGHGVVDLVHGFAASCNPTFITVGSKLGGEKLLQYSLKFGLGQTTGIGLPEERKGNLPLERRLYPGDVANLSIGQGFLEVTPLQAAVMLSTIVNDGERVKPRLVKKIIDGEGNTIKEIGVVKEGRVVSPETAAQVRMMLEAVTQYGTAKSANVPSIGSAGKTGSAQIGKSGEDLSHAWFVGYAPTKEKPRWVVSIFIEEGKSGGMVAAPVFREVIQGILGK